MWGVSRRFQAVPGGSRLQGPRRGGVLLEAEISCRNGQGGGGGCQAREGFERDLNVLRLDASANFLTKKGHAGVYVSLFNSA